MFSSRDESGGITGIDLRSLSPGTALVVDTRNSRYHVLMLDGSGSNALVQGGRYFSQEAKVRINGSAVAASRLKIGWIELGLCVEVSAGGQRIVTSPVRSISVEPNPVLALSHTGVP
jgi:hypothetical protein